MKEQWSKGGGIAAVAAVWLVAVGGLLWWGFDAMFDAEEAASESAIAEVEDPSPGCEPAVQDQQARSEEKAATTGEPATDVDPIAAGAPAAEGESDPAPATLTLRDNTTTTVTFGRGTGRLQRQFDYIISDPGELLPAAGCLQVDLSPFIRDSGDAQLEPTMITATATVSGDRALVVVNFDRTASALGDPGSYAGSVRIVDPRVERTDVSLQVTLAFPFWQLPLALFVAMLLPAMSYVWMLKGSFANAEPLNLAKFQTYLFSRNGIITVGAGVVAAVGIYSATYLSGPTWGSSVVQAITLFGSAFAAFAAAATAVSAAGADGTDTQTRAQLIAAAVDKSVAATLQRHLGPSAQLRAGLEQVTPAPVDEPRDNLEPAVDQQSAAVSKDLTAPGSTAPTEGDEIEDAEQQSQSVTREEDPSVDGKDEAMAGSHPSNDERHANGNGNGTR